jgi:hypothetical protein
MASGNFISATGVNLNLYITWSSTENVAGNYSDVVMTAYLRHSSLYVGARADQVLKAEGTSKTYDAPAISYSSTSLKDTQIGQQTIRVYHNSDGTMPSCDLYGSYYFNGTYGGKSISTITASKTVALDTIPRKSSISALTSPVAINGTNQVTVTISRADSSFTHKVEFILGAETASFTGIATSKAYAIPLSWLNQLPNAATGSAKCRVTTYSGTTSLGYVESTFTVNVPDTIIPVVTDIQFSKDMTNAADPFSAGIYVRGISKISLSGVSVTNQYSATSKTYKTYMHPGSSEYTTGAVKTGSSFISDAIPFFGQVKLTEIVTDTRDRNSVPYSETIVVEQYFAPNVTVYGERCNASGQTDPNGSFINIRLQATVASVGNDNSKVYKLEYKKLTDVNWTEVSTASQTGYTCDLSAIRAADPGATYQVRGTATDKLQSTQKMVSVATATVVLDFLAGGLGVAFGKAAELSNIFEMGLDAAFNKDVVIQCPTGESGILSVSGVDADIDLVLTPKGAGAVMLSGSTGGLVLPNNGHVSGITTGGQKSSLIVRSLSDNCLINWDCIGYSTIYAANGCAVNLYFDNGSGTKIKKYIFDESAFLPSTQYGQNIGADGQEFNNAFIKNLYLGVGNATSTYDYMTYDDSTNSYKFYADAYVGEIKIGDGTFEFGETSAGYQFRLAANYFRPTVDNTVYLGSPSYRWKTIYCATATINTSDERYKEEIRKVPLGMDFINALNPISYKNKEGKRLHFGFSAQQVIKTLDAFGIPDAGVFTKSPKDQKRPFDSEMNEEDVIYGLRYTELLSPMVLAMQELHERIKVLEHERKSTKSAKLGC